MSGHGFHVHGPHDHAVEHASHGHHGGGDDFASKIAVVTAVLSTLGALFSYEGGHTQNAALLYKNEAAIQKTAASDQWNYYQAKSNKQNLAELSVTLTKGDDRDKFIKAVDRYRGEKEEIKAKAEELEHAAKEANHEADHEMHLHGRWALATTLLQISIALSAIALLTRKKWLLLGVYGASGVGCVIAGLALLDV
ncbi:MAG TPA: DUF4337 domain-containing protein [Rhodocyclaceae bacterium]